MTANDTSTLIARYKSLVRDRYCRQEMVPWWKGYVTYSYCRDETIVAPVPFNILFHLVYSLYRWLARFPLEFEQHHYRQEEIRRKYGQ